MNASRTFGPFVVGAMLLSGSTAFAGPHGSAAPPIHMSSPALHPFHVSHMRPFTPPKPSVYVPASVPPYFPYWPAFGALPFGSIGLFANRCGSGLQQTLGDLGPAGDDVGFAPIARSVTPAFDTLASAEPDAVPQTVSPQMFCEPAAFEGSSVNLNF